MFIVVVLCDESYKDVIVSAYFGTKKNIKKNVFIIFIVQRMAHSLVPPYTSTNY